MGKIKQDGRHGGTNILTVFRLSQRLMKGSRGKLYFLLAVLVLFNVEAALMMPLVLKYGFEAVAENDMGALMRTAAGGACVFAFNFAVMYFINVYGDAWATKFSFHAAENGFKAMSGLPVASLQAVHNDDDLFNRIAAGTGNIVGFYFSMANLLGNGAAVLALMVMLYRFSSMLGIFIILLVAVELVIVRLQFHYNVRYTRKLQEDKAAGIRRVRSLLEQMSFHQQNQTWDWMRGMYGEVRKQWFCTQEKRTMAEIILESCRTSIHGFFKMGIVYNFMVQKGVFSTYADEAASSFSTFSNLTEKAKGFGGGISRLPNSFVPIGKLDEILAGKRENVSEKADGHLMLEHMSVAIGDKAILKDVCCRIPLGSTTAVIGENGSGKSTWMKAVAGLYRWGDGKVHEPGCRAAYIPADDFLFQGHTVLENIAYAGDGTDTDNIKKLLEELQFPDVETLCGKVPAQLSGGEAKRINIARALFSDAEVVLADEPTSSLDGETAGKVMGLLLGLDGKTVIYITHNPEYAAMADRIIFMQDGEIRQIIRGGECACNEYFRLWSKDCGEV